MSVIMKADRHRFVAPLRWERMAGGTKAGARLDKVAAQGFVFSKPSLCLSPKNCLSSLNIHQHLSILRGKKKKASNIYLVSLSYIITGQNCPKVLNHSNLSPRKNKNCTSENETSQNSHMGVVEVSHLLSMRVPRNTVTRLASSPTSAPVAGF